MVSPGEAALEAALNPAKGKWLYFVSVDPRTDETKFTRSYEKFLEWVVIVLMVVLAVEVTVGVVFRTMGASLVWYGVLHAA